MSFLSVNTKTAPAPQKGGGSGKYVWVDESDQGVDTDLKSTQVDQKIDVKVVTLVPRLAAKRAMSRANLGKGGKAKKGGGKIVTVDLFYRSQVASSSGSALAVTVGLVPASSSEYSALSGLFDEIKVNHIEVSFYVQTAYGAAGSGNYLGAMGYDSTYNTTPSSVADVLEGAQSMLFRVEAIQANNALSPLSETKDGLHKFRISIPKGPVANAAAVTGGTGIVANFPGQWMAVGDTADSVGFLRYYVESQGASNTATITYMTRLNCSFRERT